MAYYKIPVTKEKFMEVINPKKSEDELSAESTNLKGKLDFYMEQLKKYDGKTLGEIANAKYEGEKLSYDTRTDEDLSKMARDYAQNIKEQKESKLKESMESKKNVYLEKEIDAKRQSEEDIKKLSDEYEEVVKDSKNNAIKKGIGRSSIIENLLKQQKEGFDSEVSKVRNVETQKLKLIDDEIKLLEEQIQKSIKAYDMEAAFNYNEKLTELNEERNEINKKISQHNEKVDKKIAEYANELEKTADGRAIKDFIFERSGEYVIEGKKALIAYLESLPKEKAYEEIESEDWDYFFGKGMKDYLRKILNRTKS